MSGIPAASIRGVDLQPIFRQFPDKAREIERIGKLTAAGQETDDEFLRLCQLLFDVGYVAKSEELLRANANEGNANHRLYIKLHGMKAEEHLLRAVNQFSSQFGVDLLRLRSPRYLDIVYDCRPRHIPTDVPDNFLSLLLSEPEVEVAYYSSEEVVADVFGKGLESDDSGVVPAQPLTYQNGMWLLQGHAQK